MASSPSQHLQHLIVHGLLHLLGHDHASEADAEAMERMEAEILAPSVSLIPMPRMIRMKGDTIRQPRSAAVSVDHNEN